MSEEYRCKICGSEELLIDLENPNDWFCADCLLKTIYAGMGYPDEKTWLGYAKYARLKRETEEAAYWRWKLMEGSK